MKSSKRKRCTTNEGTHFLVPIGVTAAADSVTTNLLLTKYNDDDNNTIIMNRLITQKNTTTNNSNTNMFPNNRQNETQLIKDSNLYYRSDASSPLLTSVNHIQLYSNKMEPPATTTTINNCLKQSNLIDKSANNNEQLLYINENSKQVNELHRQSITNQFYSTNISSSNIVAAKSSSYYNLTPASSTTSLNDLSLFHNNNNNNNDIKLNKKKASQTSTVNLVRTSSKKRTRTTTIEQKQQQQQAEEIDNKKNTTTSEQIAVNAATTSRRRGRPPKNNLIKSQIEPSPLLETPAAPPPPVATALVQSNKVTEQIEVKVADIPQQPAKNDNTHLHHHHHSFHRTHSSSNKLIKSSNSNLQKSKIAAEVAVVESTKDSGILTNKSNTNNVNTKQPQPQPQITDYLVDQQQLKKQQQQQQENLSDIENHQIKTPIKSNNKQTINEDSFQTPDHNLTPTTPMPKLSWANNNELWQVMRRKELKYSHDPNYLKRHLNIESQMRAILLDWLVEISYAYRLHRETWYLAVEYMDRFLTCSKQQMRIDRLQLIGMSSLFLAAKVEEIYPPKLKELASHMETYSTNNEDAISQFELFMLKTLNWEISPVTANTWLMTYLQIASINYYSIINSNSNNNNSNNVLSTNMVMPLSIYKNNNNLSKLGLNNDVNLTQQEFYLENYMKSVTLLDLCMFDMESLKFSYSILAASAMYHMITLNNNSTASANNNNNNQNKALFVQTCTGYKLYELDACIKWMYPYADVCKDIITEEKMIEINQFANIESDDCHNIQLYYQNLELLKEAESRKTPSKFYSNSNLQLLLTPPDSHRKFSSSNSSISCSYVSDSTILSNTIISTPASSTNTTTNINNNNNNNSK